MFFFFCCFKSVIFNVQLHSQLKQKSLSLLTHSHILRDYAFVVCVSQEQHSVCAAV